MKTKIDNKAIWMSDGKAVIELKIENIDGTFLGEDFTTYETFKDILELFEWVAKNIDYIREAIDSDYEIEITIHSKNGTKEWFFSIDNYGDVRFSMKADGLMENELKECKEKLKEIRKLVV